MQAWDFRPGGNFVLDMQRAAAETDKTLVVLSENYLNASLLSLNALQPLQMILPACSAR
ncbi:MAG: toll/interleukin-1 receptor domain-containing protein [Cyanobacteria bacterium P01_H01_bin.21]